jgi:small subunit ribosomal protein S4
MIRKGKRYVRPKKLYEKSRIEEENALAERYGLKNKREIWKTISKVSYYRRRAKALAKSSSEEQEVLFGKLRDLGLKTESVADVLALSVEDILRRRLPSIVVQKKLAHTVRQARQMVVHKNVRVDGRVVNVPSYLVSVADEQKITVKALPRPASKSTKEKESAAEPKTEAIE